MVCGGDPRKRSSSHLPWPRGEIRTLTSFKISMCNTHPSTLKAKALSRGSADTSRGVSRKTASMRHRSLTGDGTEASAGIIFVTDQIPHFHDTGAPRNVQLLVPLAKSGDATLPLINGSLRRRALVPQLRAPGPAPRPAPRPACAPRPAPAPTATRRGRPVTAPPP